MTNVWVVILIIIVSYWRIRNLYYNYIELKFQLDLYRLRDKLRMAAIDGKTDSKEWFFDYMDSSICKTIEEVTSLNLISVVILAVRNKNNKDVPTFLNKLNLSIEKTKENKIIFEEYGKIISDYIMKKHYFLRIILNVLTMILITKETLKIITMTKKLRVYPETSTMQVFA